MRSKARRFFQRLPDSGGRDTEYARVFSRNRMNQNTILPYFRPDPTLVIDVGQPRRHHSSRTRRAHSAMAPARTRLPASCRTKKTVTHVRQSAGLWVRRGLRIWIVREKTAGPRKHANNTAFRSRQISGLKIMIAGPTITAHVQTC